MIYPYPEDDAGCQGEGCKQGRLPCPHPSICFDPDRQHNPFVVASLIVGVIVMLLTVLIVYVVVSL